MITYEIIDKTGEVVSTRRERVLADIHLHFMREHLNTDCRMDEVFENAKHEVTRQTVVPYKENEHADTRTSCA